MGEFTVDRATLAERIGRPVDAIGMRLEVFFPAGTTSACAFNLSFDEIPETPPKGIGGHAMFSASAYLLSAVLRDCSTGKRPEQVADILIELSETALRLAAQDGEQRGPDPFEAKMN